MDAQPPAWLNRLRTAEHQRHPLSLWRVGHHQAEHRIPQHHFAVTLESKTAIVLRLANWIVGGVQEVVCQLHLVSTIRHFLLLVA